MKVNNHNILIRNNIMGGGKRITFLFPNRALKPVGGFKVAFEYANRLAEDGYDVKLIYPVISLTGKVSIKQRLRSYLRYFYWKISGYSARGWFKLHNNIKERLVYSIRHGLIPNTDVFIATAYQTAYALKRMKLNNTNNLYLIQDYENWYGMSADGIDKSYRFGLQNIVISNWLLEKVRNAGSDATLIKNGFDFDYFKKTISIENRNHLSIAMLYHSNERKGCKYGIEAIIKVKQKYPNLRVSLFGTQEKPKDIPLWIEYYQQPDEETHNKIYNNAAIFIAPSLQEGWGLTVGEAMICGAAVVCTDTLGFKEMVRDGINGLIVPIKDSEALAEGIISLIEDQDKRIRLATQGNKDIQAFSWEASYKKLKGLIDLTR